MSSGWDTLPPEIRTAIALAGLTPEETAALKAYAGGMGYRRIARAHNISRDTARNRVERALRKIRPHLADVTA